MIEPGPLLMSLLNARPPDRLFHYTSLAGLEGIAKSKTVWASAAQFLNDAKEYRLAIEIARRETAGLQHRETKRPRARFLEYLHDQWERMENLEVCIFSLSREGDLLSQWRAYCPPAGGYSIGFAGQDLREIVAPQGGYIAPCVYDMDVQVNLVREALAPIIRRLPPEVPDSEDEMRVVGEEYATLLFNQLILVAPLIKHYSFAEEKEWRLIWIPGRAPDVKLCFRPGRGTFIPYVALSLNSGERIARFEQIIVGPMPHQVMASNALSGALHEREMPWAQSRPSQVPYRTW